MRSASEVSERYLELRRLERERRAEVDEMTRAMRARVGDRPMSESGGTNAEEVRAGLTASLEEMRIVGQREALAWALGVNEALTLVPPRREDRADIDRVRVTPVPAYDCYLLEFPRGDEGSIPARPWGAFVSRPHAAELLAQLLLTLGPWSGEMGGAGHAGKVVPVRGRKKPARRSVEPVSDQPEGA